MYVKVLNGGGSRVFSGVSDVEFFRREFTHDELTKQIDYSDIPIIERGTLTAALDHPVEIGNLNIVFDNGKSVYVLFDSVAFLCNEQGKAVERYVSSIGAGEKT